MKHLLLVALLAVPVSAAEDFVPNMPLDVSDRGYRLWQIDMASIVARIGRYDAARRIVVLEAEDGNTLGLGIDILLPRDREHLRHWLRRQTASQLGPTLATRRLTYQQTKEARMRSPAYAVKAMRRERLRASYVRRPVWHPVSPATLYARWASYRMPEYGSYR